MGKTERGYLSLYSLEDAEETQHVVSAVDLMVLGAPPQGESFIPTNSSLEDVEILADLITEETHLDKTERGYLSLYSLEDDEEGEETRLDKMERDYTSPYSLEDVNENGEETAEDITLSA